jgi:hypothetical protein
VQKANDLEWSRPQMARTSSTTPEWASFFDERRWTHFVDVVRDDLGARGLEARIDESAGCVRIADGRVLGLGNLAQMCAQASGDRWPGIVSHHLGLALQPPDAPKDFATVRPLLKLRLWSRVDLPQTELAYWDIAEDLVAVLTLDLPQMLATVSAKDTASWPASRDELWYLALANTRGGHRLVQSTHDIGGGAAVHELDDNSDFFAASHLLFLESYVRPSPHGAIVAVPRRHTIVFSPITPALLDHAMKALLRVVPAMWHDGPGSISPSLYWWRPQMPLSLLTRRTDQGLVLAPPAGFAMLQN